MNNMEREKSISHGYDVAIPKLVAGRESALVVVVCMLVFLFVLHLISINSVSMHPFPELVDSRADRAGTVEVSI